MIKISRAAAGRFRAVARRCVVGKSRSMAPPLLVARNSDATTLFCDWGEIALALSLPEEAGPPETTAMPAALFDKIASVKNGIAEIDTGHCRWDGQELNWTPLAPVEGAGPWQLPPDMKPVPMNLLAALHECGRSAARHSARYSLKRLQLQGRAGQIVASDGSQLLIWKGFRFPFRDSVLVPAIPVFSCPELSDSKLCIGKGDRHIVVTASPWTIWLMIDGDGHFPNVESIIPKSFDCELHLSESDSQTAIPFLNQVVKEDDSHSGATLESGERLALRAKTDVQGRVSEIVLKDSRATGGAGAWAFNRDHLARALALGLRHLCINRESGPAVWRDECRTYVAMPLHPSLILPSHPQLSVITHEPDLGDTMPSETNGRIAPEQAPSEAIDFLAEAEALRDALAEVARRSARLVGSLKHLQKQRRVLETAWSSLKNLRRGS